MVPGKEGERKNGNQFNSIIIIIDFNQNFEYLIVWKSYMPFPPPQIIPTPNYLPCKQIRDP